MTILGTSALRLIIPVLLLQLPRLPCFKFTKEPQSPIILVLGHNTTNVDMEWTFEAEGSTIASWKVKRFLKNKDSSLSKETDLAYFSPSLKLWNRTLYIVDSSFATPGYANFTVKDVLKRADNADQTKVSSLSGDVYSYRLEVDIAPPSSMDLVTKKSSLLELQVYFVFSVEPPKAEKCNIISKNMINGAVVEGETVTLLCNEITGSDPLNIRWTSGSHVWNQVNLTFNSVNRENTGNYHVTVNNGKECNETATENLTLTVYFPASCIIHPGSINITEGKVVTINIFTTGNPPVYEYIWTHPNGSRLTANSRLTFTASRQDTGTYEVSVYNGVGERGNCLQIINVHYPTDRIACSNKTVLEGDDVQLVCSANGNPPPDMMWIRNGNIRGMGSTLLIKGVTKSEGGTYTFLANNSLGYKSMKISIAVQTRAKSPEIMNPYKQVLLVNEGKDVSLVCNASGYPVPNITWTKHGTVIGVGSIFNIARVKRNDSSCYTCTADNGIGHAKNASICLDVPYPPSNVKITPSIASITLKEGDNLSLYCQGDSNPDPTYAWGHNGELLTSQQNRSLIIKDINRRHNGLYRCKAKNRLGFVLSKPIEVVVQYLDPLEVIGWSNKSYSQSNPLVLFNLSINAYPSNTSLSCSPSAPNILTTIISHDARLNGKQYLVFVVIQNDVDNASIVCKAENGVGVRERSLHFYRRPILLKESFAGQFRLTYPKWQDDLQDVKSSGYNDLKQKCIKILEAAYLGVPYLDAIKIKDFIKGSIIVRFEFEVIGKVPDPLLPLRDYIKTQGEEINGLQIDYNSIQKSSDQENKPIPCKEENKTLLAVLGALFGLSIVLIIILIVGFLWFRRKDPKGNSGEKSNGSDKIGQMNDISLQETSFNATDNETPNVPEYEPIGRRGLSTSNVGIPEYEAVTTRTQLSQPHSGVQTNIPMPQYESTDQHGQTEAVSKQPPVTYQTIQHHTGNYDSLIPSTRLSPKGAVLSSTGSPTRTGEYQALQHRGLSPQYQSLNDLSKC